MEFEKQEATLSINLAKGRRAGQAPESTSARHALSAPLLLTTSSDSYIDANAIAPKL